MADKNNLKASIDADIVEVAKSEKITKTILARLSRTLLVYVPDSNDIATVNRLIDVLTRGNAKIAGLYFTHFLPWKYDKDTGHFGAMIKSKKDIAAKAANREAWLDNEANDIWLWAEREVKIEPREKNYKAQIASLVTRAMTANGENERFKLSARDVIGAVITGGVSMEDLMAEISKATVVRATEQANENEAAEAEAAAKAE